MNPPAPGTRATPPADVADSQERPSARWRTWMLPTFIVACWVLAIRHLSPDWSLNEQYHYGWIVPLLALYLIKVRFEKCPPRSPAPSPGKVRAILFLITACAVMAMPLREANMQWRSMGWWLSVLAAAVTVAGFWQAGGRNWARHFLFPIAFFFTAVPLLREVEERGMRWLMQHNARLSVEILHWAGVEVEARGNLIALPSGTLGVDEACSGIRSLQGTLMLTLFLGEILSLSGPRRLLLLLSGFLWALATNVGRTSALGWIADRHGLHTMEGWHDTAGYTVLAICSVLVGLTAWLLNPRKDEVLAPPADFRIDLPGIARRMQSAAAPAAIGIALLGAGLFGTELWFRAHEREDVALTPWRFRMPIERRNFERTDIPARTRADLRFDEGYGGSWLDEAGRKWQALYFRWKPGRNAAQTVGVHDPRACLAAVGMKEASTLPRLDLAIGDLFLPIDAYHFKDGPLDVFVFNCLIEDVRRGEAHRRVREDNSISSRFVAALAGKRHRGQRRFEVAVWGAADADAAARDFRALVASQIHLEDTSRQ